MTDPQVEIEPGRCYYAKRVRWHWEVWYCRNPQSPDPHSGATEWLASSVKYWRWINAARTANEMWRAFNDGVWVAGVRQADAEAARIMAMSDDEIIAECRARGEDPDEVAGRVRGVMDRAIALSKLPPHSEFDTANDLKQRG